LGKSEQAALLFPEVRDGLNAFHGSISPIWPIPNIPIFFPLLGIDAHRKQSFPKGLQKGEKTKAETDNCLKIK
jgi:hypothetical protein